MKAEVKWFYPNGVKDGDIFKFSVSKPINLPLLTNEDSSDETAYLSGGTIEGTPVLAIISKEGQERKVEGILIKDIEKNGVYVVPKEYVSKQPISIQARSESPIESLVKESEEVVSGSLEDVKKFDTEKILGFSKKQLLVMALTVFVIIKIAK